MCEKEGTCVVISGRIGGLRYGYMLLSLPLIVNCDRECEQEINSL